MVRRKTINITGLRGTGSVDYTDVFIVFECGNKSCQELIKVSKFNTVPDLLILKCLRCSYKNTNKDLIFGNEWKYCRLCERLQPVANYHNHKPTSNSFKSGKQLECKSCKNKKINPILNPKRTSDQHRESAQRRRLYSLLSGNSEKIDSKRVFEKFNNACFKCSKKLIYKPRGSKDYHLDHTLPAVYLWPLSTDSTTLLCSKCNNSKHGMWPSEFYNEKQLKKLSFLTGIEHTILSASPMVNPHAINLLLSNVDDFITKWIRYPNEIKRIRKIILNKEGIDIFTKASNIPKFLID